MSFELLNEDCIPAMERMAEEGRKFDLAVFSPPFASLFTYSNKINDMGNSQDSDDEFNLHHRFFVDALFKVMKPGRIVAVHIQQVTRSKASHGYIGLWDIRGEMIRQYVDAGFRYWGEVTIDACPQSQAIRTRSSQLQFASLRADSLRLRPALSDYVMLFKMPGDAEKRIQPYESGEVTQDDWISWARPVWYGIVRTNTLNVKLARSGDDERHLCPLQVDLIERIVRLYTERGETVFSPFAGIGSEGHVSLALGRDFVGTELKPEYADIAKVNLAAGVEMSRENTAQMGLFSGEVEDANFQGSSPSMVFKDEAAAHRMMEIVMAGDTDPTFEGIMSATGMDRNRLLSMLRGLVATGEGRNDV